VRSFVRAYNERFSATVLLTSHYMDDVAELCPRVLVIDHGRVVFDGALGELVQRIRPDKRVQLRLSRPVERRDLEPLGTIVEHGAEAVILQVSHDQLQSSVQRALAGLPLRDLSVEDPPLEEVMRELFARGAEERALPATGVARGAEQPDGAA
jgi:ABC-2 type transport system ATP-binding protein